MKTDYWWAIRKLKQAWRTLEDVFLSVTMVAAILFIIAFMSLLLAEVFFPKMTTVSGEVTAKETYVQYSGRGYTTYPHLIGIMTDNGFVVPDVPREIYYQTNIGDIISIECMQRRFIDEPDCSSAIFSDEKDTKGE